MSDTLNFNREYKDSLFRCIFGRENERSKRWRLDLYNALNNSNYTNPDELELRTIENVIYISIKNDLAFLVDGKMNLIEHQSTFNPNMPLRGLMYFSLLYQIWLTKQEKDLYGSTIVQIPTPQFFVLYNGESNVEDRIQLRLSDAFMIEDKSGNFEWTATMLNINAGHNNSLGKKCKVLYDYVRYVLRVRTNLKTMSKQDAISEAVNWAIKENLLEGFIKENKAEVIAVSLTEFDEELFIKNRRQEGYQQKAIEDAVLLIQKYNVTPENAAKDMNAPLDKVLEMLKDLNKN